MNSLTTDILVVGGGNAGLCAAIAAAEQGKSVILIEKAPHQQRGGNSSLTMNFRFPHNSIDDLMNLLEEADRMAEGREYLEKFYQPYAEEDFYQDLHNVSLKQADTSLLRILATRSSQTIRWLRKLGHQWELKPKVQPGSLPIRIKGGGRCLVERSFSVAERLGVRIFYECPLIDLLWEEGGVAWQSHWNSLSSGPQGRPEISPVGDSRTSHTGTGHDRPHTLAMGGVIGAVARLNGRPTAIQATAVVLACGGFEASIRLRERYLGQPWKDVACRGVPFNTGDGIEAAEKIGALLHGELGGCHATPQDAKLAAYMLPDQNSASQANSRYAFTYGITVNLLGERFVDEGESFTNRIYAKMGREIVAQPQKISFQIFDAKLVKFLPKDYFSSENFVRAGSIDELAEKLGIDPRSLERTIAVFNAGIGEHKINLLREDGVSTLGVSPQKSNWALRIDRAPFFAFPVRAGITFTYGGLKIDELARVIDKGGGIIPGLFACGEIVGGIFYHNYLGGSGLMAGACFGRLAGQVAASGRCS